MLSAKAFGGEIFWLFREEFCAEFHDLALQLETLGNDKLIQHVALDSDVALVERCAEMREVVFPAEQ